VKLRTVLQNVPDPRGKQGQYYFLLIWSILGLIVVSLLCGRRGMLAAFHLRRCLNKRQRVALGFTKGVTPCHATLTETLRAIDGGTLADVLGAACFAEGEDSVTSPLTARPCARRRTAMPMRRMCCRRSVPVCKPFSAPRPRAGQGHGVSRCAEIAGSTRFAGQGRHRRRDVLSKNRSWRRSPERAAATCCRSRTIRRTCGRISKRLSKPDCNEPVFPLVSFESALEKAHGRIERRAIDELPTEAAGIEQDWPSVKHICRVTRFRQGKKNGQWKAPEEEVAYLIARFPDGEASPEALLSANRGHWGMEIMHRNKDVILGEDAYTNRSDDAPRNIFSLIGFALKILKSVSPSPTRAIEQFQDDRNKAMRLLAG
jgi:hypothetical protein